MSGEGLLLGSCLAVCSLSSCGSQGKFALWNWLYKGINLIHKGSILTN